MSKLAQLNTSNIIILLCLLASGYVIGDELETITRDSLVIHIPNPLGQTPILETNEQEGGRYLGFHIPLLIDFQFHLRDLGDLPQTKFSMNLLSGMLEFVYDKKRTQDGSLYGPLKFGLLTFSLYDNDALPT